MVNEAEWPPRILCYMGARMLPAGAGLGAVVFGLLALPITTAQATFPGENGQIAISGDNVYVVDPETGVFDELTDKRGVLDYNASFSANGRRIVFSRYSRRTNRSNVFIMRSDGAGRAHRVTTGRSDGDPAFSPDGKTIVFSARPRRRGPRVVIVNRDGTGRTALGPGYAPSYAPDGQRIVFQRRGARGNPRLLTMASDGTDVQALTVDGASARYASYSPDGSRIVMDYHNSDTRQSGIFTIRPNGTELTPIALTPPAPDFYEEDPVFSPDGTQIAFVHIDYQWLEESCVCVFLARMAADGTGMEHVLRGGSTPDWGPEPNL